MKFTTKSYTRGVTIEFILATKRERDNEADKLETIPILEPKRLKKASRLKKEKVKEVVIKELLLIVTE